jgi:ribosomal protein L4
MYITFNREKTSQVELRDEVFAVPVKKHVLHQVITTRLMNRGLEMPPPRVVPR